jgi:ariadne-1
VHESKVTHKPKEGASKSKSRARKKQLDPETDVGGVEDICTCNKCGARACATCDRPYHEGETCSAYQARVKDRAEEEDKSVLEVSKMMRAEVIMLYLRDFPEAHGFCPTL